MATLAHLRALHAAIGSALDEIDRVYDAHDLDFPSPDAPISPNSEAEKLTSEPAVAKATGAIVYACAQLSKAVHPPFYTLMENAQAVGHLQIEVLAHLLTACSRVTSQLFCNSLRPAIS